MHLTFLMPADDLSGGNRVVATYASRLQSLGHSVRVVSNAPDPVRWADRLRAWRRRPATRPPALVGHVAASGVPHTVLDRPRPIRADDLPDADLVIATWWETAEWMHALPASKGRPVHLIQGYEVWGGAATHARLHRTLRLPNRKVAISATLAREIQAAVGPLDIAVVPNAVDTDRFDAPPRERQAAPTVGFIYSTQAIKGTDLCIEACRLARERLPGLRMLTFGTEAPTPALALPPDSDFILRPPQASIPALYARCDAWLFGSRRDSFGLPILEAMACRTPVVGVPVGAAPELLADGAGTLVASARVEDLAQALVDLLQQPAADWRAVSSRAHAVAHRRNWAMATEQLLHCIAA
jgi:glycosyltransferase involved in cell wall biosynthesis